MYIPDRGVLSPNELLFNEILRRVSSVYKKIESLPPLSLRVVLVGSCSTTTHELYRNLHIWLFDPHLHL